MKQLKKIKPIQQLNQFECGICCLKMILDYYSIDTTLSEVRSKLESGFTGINILTLKKAVESFNLSCHVKRVSNDQMKNLKQVVPMILLWNNNHFVVIESIKNNKFVIIDPAIGRLEINKDEFETKFSNISIIIEPNGKVDKNKKPIDFKKYLNIVEGNYKNIAYIVLVSFLAQCLTLIIPILIKSIIDMNIYQENFKISALLIMMGIIIVQVICSYLKDFLIVKLQTKMDYDLMNRFISHMIYLPYKFFQLRSKGDIIQRLNSNLTIREILSQKLISTIINIILLFIVAIYMYTQSKLITLVNLALGLILFIIVFLSKNKNSILINKQIMSQAKTSSLVTEALDGVATIKALGIEDFIVNDCKKLLQNQQSSFKNSSLFQTKINNLTNSILMLSPVLVLILSLGELNKGNLTLGGLMAFQSLTISFLTPIISIATMINDINMLDILLERINDVMKEEKDIFVNNNSYSDLQGCIRLKNVYFKYINQGKYILKDISLDIDRGKKVAIVGESGSGKTTLALIIASLYHPSEGKIYIDNMNSSDINKDLLRKKIGVVLQDNFLFNKTIFENISINNPNATIEEVKKVCEIAAIDYFIESLPMKYNTILAESGSNLSGGQRQRLALARALINNPSVIILDEATSALDSITEMKISENIKKLNCTQVIVAHRLSTISECDEIILLKDGEIECVGRHEYLLTHSAYYKSLYKNNNHKEEAVC